MVSAYEIVLGLLAHVLSHLFQLTTIDEPVFLTGEMIYPWMFEELGALRPFHAAAELLAEKADWPTLYDPAALARNEVPTFAAVYHDDMYVPTVHSLATARAVPLSKR